MLVKTIYAISFGTTTSSLSYLSSNGVRWPIFMLRLLDSRLKSCTVIMTGRILN